MSRAISASRPAIGRSLKKPATASTEPAVSAEIGCAR